MTENEAIEILRNNFPKTCKMVDGRYVGGFDDTECEFGNALLLAISALEKIQRYQPCVAGNTEFRFGFREGRDSEGSINYFMYCCPNCGADYEIGKKYNSCPACGRAFDWGSFDSRPPLGYDGKRVIERLETILMLCEDYHRKHGNCGNQIYAYKIALKIVKSGGFEE